MPDAEGPWTAFQGAPTPSDDDGPWNRYKPSDAGAALTGDDEFDAADTNSGIWVSALVRSR